jgi:hypothetical protein
MEGRATAHHSCEFPCRMISDCSCMISAETPMIFIAPQAAVRISGEAGQRRRRPTTCKSLVEVVGILFQGQ